MTPTDIADRLQTDILAGALPPGTPLSQVDLAARFGVSRIPVRDALAQLVTQGVITAEPNRTATVLKLTQDEVRELFEIRTLLECDLFAQALQVMTEADLAAIEAALEQSSSDAEDENWAQGDAMFHAALYAPAKRPRQQALVDELRRTARVQIAGYAQLQRKTPRWVQEHEGIVEVCRAGDAKEAERRLKRHLRGARNVLLKAMRHA